MHVLEVQVREQHQPHHLDRSLEEVVLEPVDKHLLGSKGFLQAAQSADRSDAGQTDYNDQDIE